VTAIDNAERMVRMRGRLQAAFAPDVLEVVDDSHKHVGHAGARDGRGHFSVEIRSDAFAGLPSLARHRAVYAALGDMMTTDIHALSIHASAPSDAARSAG
jgi:BolA protein